VHRVEGYVVYGVDVLQQGNQSRYRQRYMDPELHRIVDPDPVPDLDPTFEI
jgi:hypothetical protein